jgi:hypothetical protein
MFRHHRMLALLGALILPAAALVGFAPAAAAHPGPPVGDPTTVPTAPTYSPTTDTGGFPLWAVFAVTAGAVIVIAAIALIAFATRRRHRPYAQAPSH